MWVPQGYHLDPILFVFSAFVPFDVVFDDKSHTNILKNISNKIIVKAKFETANQILRVPQGYHMGPILFKPEINQNFDFA